METNRFPDIAQCEAVWEAKADLAVIRADSRHLMAMALPFGKRSFKDQVLANRRLPLRRAVEELSLSKGPATRLLSDLMLVSAWYLLPQRRAHMATDLASDRKLLGKLAKRFAAISLNDELAARNLIEAVPIEPRSELDAINLDELFRQMYLFQRAAEEVEERLRAKTGRRPEARRDAAMLIVADALAQVGVRISLSRGTDSRAGYHFTNPGGRLLRTVMGRLGWPDEAVLARAYERCRRATR